MKFRKKPIIIDATQWQKNGDHPEVTTKGDTAPGFLPGTHGWIETREGGYIVTPGDWIITDVDGKHYPCKPDIFAATYEPA